PAPLSPSTTLFRSTAREVPPALEDSVGVVHAGPRTRQGSSLADADAPRTPELAVPAQGKGEPSVELARHAAVDESPHSAELAAGAGVVESPLSQQRGDGIVEVTPSRGKDNRDVPRIGLREVSGDFRCH